MKILFICRGNVGRSQIAEAMFKKMAGDTFQVVSAGVKLSGDEQPIGELLPQIKEVLDVMKEEGIDVSSNKRKQITEKMVHDSDIVVAILEKQEEIPDYLIHSPKLIRWEIPDPKGKDLEFTRRVKDQIVQKMKEFIKVLE